MARQVELEQARLSYGCPTTIILDPADTRDVRQILLDYLFSFGRQSGRLCGMRADNFLRWTPAPRHLPPSTKLERDVTTARRHATLVAA